jgi:hypothetical protein
MRNIALATVAIAWLLLLPAPATIAGELPNATDVAAATRPAGAGGFPFMQIDANTKQIRVECESLRVEAPLEFFLCVTGTTEHESVLRSKVRPSHLHAAMLLIGLKPGEPVRFSEAQNKWLPPHGPPLQLTAIFETDGKEVRIPAYRLMRDVRTKKEMPPMTWIFAGSKIINDTYAADRTGYLASVVNFELTVIDIPRLASNANETLEWETNLELMPPKAGTPVTLLIEPAGKVQDGNGAAIQPAAPVDQALITIDPLGKIEVDGVAVKSAAEALELLKSRQSRGAPGPVRLAVAGTIEESAAAREVINALAAARVRFVVVPQAAALAGASRGPVDANQGGDVRGDEALIRRLRGQWDQAVAPHAAGLRDAARTHYEVIAQLRREQQRLVDEADKIQRLIDELEKQYQDMTTPRPE